MDPVTEAVLAANARFYQALSLADLGLMRQVWLASEGATCTHPGGQPLEGWKAIRASWRAIFKQQGPLQVTPAEMQARLFGQTAEVTCIERIDATRLPNGGLLQAQATNIFRLRAGCWKMLEHHAVPLPAAQRLRGAERYSSN